MNNEAIVFALLILTGFVICLLIVCICRTVFVAEMVSPSEKILKRDYDFMVENFKPYFDVNFKKTTETAKIPTRGSDEAAGYDLYADTQEDIVIEPHSTYLFDTGLAMELPDGYFGAIVARSGLATKKGLAPANKFGI